MKKLIFLIVLSAAVSGIIAAQEERQLFIGLRPMVTVEPEYADGAFDVNVFPLVIQWHPGAGHLAVRFTTILNVHFGEGSPRLQHAGFLVSLPWYPLSGGSPVPEKLFAGPKTGLSYQPATGVWTTGLSAEAGWSFPLGNWSVMVSGEYGASFFIGEPTGFRISGHGGISGIAGYWVR